MGEVVALADWAAVLYGVGAPPDGPLVVVDLDGPARGGPLPRLDARLPLVVVGITSTTLAPPDRSAPVRVAENGTHLHPAAAVCDLVVPTDGPDLAAVEATVAANPTASTACALLVRGSEGRTVDEGLLVESATYSALQAGSEFAAWRASRPSKPRRDEGLPVRLERDGDELHVTLDRPHVRNALDRHMRDALVDAFGLVAADESIRRVHLRGEGSAFCAGGDLDEFGSFEDPASAHLLRLRQSAGRAIHDVRDRVTAHLHGACMGSGIELPAFAGEVVAAPDAVIGLPEVSLGLVPGAGGTVSLPRRIGRHRTAWLCLTGRTIDADTALAWGLADRIAAN